MQTSKISLCMQNPLSILSSRSTSRARQQRDDFRMTEFPAGNKLERINEPGKLNLPIPDCNISLFKITQQALKLASPPLMRFKSSPQHKTCFPWWKNTLWWEGEIMRSRMPERYDVIGMGTFNQNTRLFNLYSSWLTSPVISSAPVGGCRLFSFHSAVSESDGQPVSACIWLATSLQRPLKVIFMFGLDVNGWKWYAWFYWWVRVSRHRMMGHIIPPLLIISQILQLPKSIVSVGLSWNCILASVWAHNGTRNNNNATKAPYTTINTNQLHIQ